MRYFLFVFFSLSVPLLAQQMPPPKAKSLPPVPVKATTGPVFEYPLDLAKFGLTLPATENAELRRLLDSQNTVFYKLAPVWQHYVPSSQIEYNNLTLQTKSYYNTKLVYGVYFTTFSPDFHANHNFPWETTVGLNVTFKEYKDKEKSFADMPYQTINFINLPEANGTVSPILLLSEYPIKWIFPVGTTVGEVLYVVHDGKKYIQEIRTRRKSDDASTWVPGMYRPIKDRLEFEQATGLRSYTAFNKYFHFRNPQEDEVFKMDGVVERLPALSDSEVKKLLAKPFKEVTVEAEVWSPAADQEFHIMPKNYCLSLLGSVDSHTCSNCHRQTQISVRNLTPKDPDVVKTPNKIGNIRGCDGVFTWHPFSLGSIRSSDTEGEKPLGLRTYDTSKRFVLTAPNGDPAYGQSYKLTKFVQESLKSYELPAQHFLHTIEKK